MMDPANIAARIHSHLTSGGSQGPQTYPLPTVADHELLTRIGGGGYGEVWLARSITGHYHAVKIVWRRHFSSDRPYEREFNGIRQFEPISRSHPGVVNILHVGRDEKAGCFYYVMERADAEEVADRSDEKHPTTTPSSNAQMPAYAPRTLASELRRRGRLSVSEVVALGIQLADGLGHLHRNGLVHRDVKPSNVIYVKGQPKLADIGLVAGLNEARSFVGTEGFIPPEGPGSERADLFGLGRLLYATSTGKDRCDFPMLPPELDQWSRPEREAMLELNEVLTRVCAVNPRDRHANAADLAGDLNLILAGRSVRRAYGMDRRLRQARRFSIVAGVIVMISIALAWMERRERNQADARATREEHLRERAEAAESQTQQYLHEALLEQARATVLSGELGQRVRALDALQRAGSISNSAALRGSALAALALPDLRFKSDIPIPSEATLIQLDPSFQRLALAQGTGPVQIFSTADSLSLTTLPPQINWKAYVGTWSSDGQWLLVKRDDPQTGGRRPLLEVWDMNSSECVLTVTNAVRSAFSFHPQLPQILVGTPGETAVTWNLTSKAPVQSFPLEGEPELLKYSPNGEYIAALNTTPQDYHLTIYRTKDGSFVRTSHLSDDIQTFAWHPNSPWLAVGDTAGGIHLVQAETGEAHLLGRHKTVAATTLFSPDGDYLFTGGWDRELICWNLTRQIRSYTIALNSYRIQFREDGLQTAILDLESPGLRFYAVERPSLFREFPEDLGGGRNSATFSSEGRWLAACGDKHLAVWDLSRKEPGALIQEPYLRRICFSPQGELLASRIGKGFRWQVVSSSNPEFPLQLNPLELPHNPNLISLCVLSNGIVFTNQKGSRIIPYGENLANPGDWRASIDGLNGASPDGKWLGLFRSYTSELHIHRLPDLEQVATLTHEAPISLFEFSPRGDEVAVASRKGVAFWSTSTWQRTRYLPGFTAILYSPDAQTFWLSSDYRSAGLYEASTGELLLPLPRNTLPLALSPDGRFLATSVNARRVQVWDLQEVRRQLTELGLPY